MVLDLREALETKKARFSCGDDFPVIRSASACHTSCARLASTMRAIASPPPVFRAPCTVSDRRALSAKRAVRTFRDTHCRAIDDKATPKVVPARQNNDESQVTLSRRKSLGLVAATTLTQMLFTPQYAQAAYETQTANGGSDGGVTASKASSDLQIYKRSFRERFETSISAGTHDYQFKFPRDSWKPDIVSLNDGKLYGVDLRFSNPTEGKVCTHVLPFVGEDLVAATTLTQMLFTPQYAQAAYETQTANGGSDGGVTASKASSDLQIYKRSFRERFETSISAGTHDYQFKFPRDSWKPDIVSLNDGKLYGVDLRFSNPTEGKVCTHVLPFVGEDSLRDVGPPEIALERFIELIGAFWNENGFGVPGGNAGTLLNTKVLTKDKVVYYLYETTKPHNLIAAAVTDGQLYVINASASNERQWQSGEANLRAIVESFYVPP